jgi:hypothetical protein
MPERTRASAAAAARVKPVAVIGSGRNRRVIPPPAAPLLLWPLRVEYRWLESGSWNIASEPVKRKRRAPKSPAAPLAIRRIRRTAAELLVRWFPDDVLAHEPPEALTDVEREALSTWQAALAAAPTAVSWYDMGEASINTAWQTFVGRVGYFRALHLARTGVAPPRPGGAALVGRPDRVVLYALTRDQLEPVGSGAPIAKDVAYGPAALGEGSWLTDFDRAVADGMGLRLSGNPAKIAGSADWLIACGLSDSDARTSVARFVSDKIARGDIELLAQDTPTNNSSRTESGWMQWERDPVGALGSSTWLERRTATSPPTDADRLAAALGIAAEPLYAMQGAAFTESRAGEAMTVALLPALTQYLADIVAPEGVTIAALSRFLGHHASARGPLPVLRLDHSPYGILPITTPGALQPPLAAHPADAAAFRFVSRFSAATLAVFSRYAARLPVIRPGGDGSDLREILQTLPVSARVEVTDAPGRPAAERVTCPLVESRPEPLANPKVYLAALLTTPIAQLPDPDNRDADFPLLYRLLRLSLERVMHDVPASVRSLGASDALLRMPTVQGSSNPLAEWVSSVQHLRTQSRGQLEVLMMEVLDLLDNRVDALQTSLATCRLRAMRASGVAGLKTGWYGFLAAPRRTRSVAASDGYLQAPTLPQAETAGLLRSAALRFGGAEAFDLDLSSRRARKALRTLEALRSGLEMREILGYHAERWLHDNGEDLVLHDLRDQYAIVRGDDAASARAPLLDGERLLADAVDLVRSGPPTRRRVLRALLAELAEQEDALADLVLAEAVHQLAHGNLENVNAWMNVLSCGVPPDHVDLLRTHRAGHGSSYRVSFVTRPANYAGMNPRAIAEPTVAALADQFADGFRRARVRITITTPLQGSPVTESIVVALSADLGLDPIDLLLGGLGELTTRIRSHILRIWNNDLAADFGPLPARGVEAFLNERRPLAIDQAYRSGSAPSVTDLFNALAPLQAMLTGGRALAPGDLAAGSPPEGRGLDAATHVSVLANGIATLLARAQQLLAIVEDVRSRLAGARDAVIATAAELRRQDALPVPPSKTVRDALVLAIDTALATAAAVLEETARFGILQATALETAAEVADAPEAYATRLAAVGRQLGERRDALAAAIGAAQSLPTTAQGTNALISTLTTALQDTCGGQAVTVWPPFDMVAQTTPNVGQPRDVAAALDDWPVARGRLKSAAALAAVIRDLRARRNGVVPTLDPRQPAVSYIGIHLLPTGDFPAATACGWVVDEWSDFRPATTQRTGVAVNYDSPQSEPPHVLLLGVPPNDAVPVWTEPLAAALVQETIRLMKVRALPAHHARYADVGLGGLNLVPAQESGRGRPRIPTPPRVDETLAPGRGFRWRIDQQRPSDALNATRANQRRFEDE